MTADEFKIMMSDVLDADVADIKMESNLLDFPTYDSVCALTLMARLEEEAMIECSPEQLAALKSIGDVAVLVAGPTGFSA